jgi:MFS family permease
MNLPTKQPAWIFRALRHRNYRLFFIGQGISLIGTWITRIATAWLVYRLTDSALLLGVVSFVGQIPIFLLSPLTGVLMDRWNLHRLLVVTQVLAMLQSLVLAVLTLTGVVHVWHLIGLAAFQGLINVFDTPARQAFVVRMIEDRADLGNAIALNSSMFNGARLIGPSIAGVLIALFGEGICFSIDALSYLPVIVALLAMRLGAVREQPLRTPLLHGLHEGLRYAFGFPPIRALLLLAGTCSFMGMPYMVLMPAFTRDVLQGGPNTFGFLMAAAGSGALAGALYLASRDSVRGLGRIIVLMSSLSGMGLVAFALSRTVWLSVPLLFLIGMGILVQMASSNTVLQTIVEDDKRGRVMSLYTMAVLGMQPLGSLFAGILASHIGAPFTIGLGGAACILASLIFARNLPTLRELVRPIYVQKGILAHTPTDSGVPEVPHRNRTGEI